MVETQALENIVMVAACISDVAINAHTVAPHRHFLTGAGLRQSAAFSSAFTQ